MNAYHSSVEEEQCIVSFLSFSCTRGMLQDRHLETRRRRGTQDDNLMIVGIAYQGQTPSSLNPFEQCVIFFFGPHPPS
jgi:hypothetical protein